jgi:hypothetical protein
MRYYEDDDAAKPFACTNLEFLEARRDLLEFIHYRWREQRAPAFGQKRLGRHVAIRRNSSAIKEFPAAAGLDSRLLPHRNPQGCSHY